MPPTAAVPSAPALFFDPLQLVEFTRFYADEVARGDYPFIDYDPDERWHQRIYRDRRVDIWLISWLPTQGTQLHDHGGSAGSFTVLNGELAESVVAGQGASGRASLNDNVRIAGDSVCFGTRYVHDVRNLSDAPAVSVHAYSPPLTSMTFYDLADGRLETLATLATDDPEPEFVAPPVRTTTSRSDSRRSGVQQAS